MVFFRRAGSTVLLWGLVGAAFASMHKAAYLGLIAILVLLGMIEYFQMLRAAGVRCFPRFGLLVGTAYCAVLHGALHGVGWAPDGLDGAVVAVAVIGAFLLQLRQPIRGVESLMAVAVTVCGVVYVAVLFNFVAKLLFALPAWHLESGKVAESAAFLILWLLAVTKCSDMGAYMVGSLIGRHKMIPHVSPGKTWEGFGGALGSSLLAGYGLFVAFPTQLEVLGSGGHVVVLSLVLSLLAVTGDLAESVLKRALGAKDSGRMLPGIGGALDLMDSICFTAPALYLYLRWVSPVIS